MCLSGCTWKENGQLGKVFLFSGQIFSFFVKESTLLAQNEEQMMLNVCFYNPGRCSESHIVFSHVDQNKNTYAGNVHVWLLSN